MLPVLFVSFDEIFQQLCATQLYASAAAKESVTLQSRINKLRMSLVNNSDVAHNSTKSALEACLKWTFTLLPQKCMDEVAKTKHLKSTRQMQMRTWTT